MQFSGPPRNISNPCSTPSLSISHNYMHLLSHQHHATHTTPYSSKPSKKDQPSHLILSISTLSKTRRPYFHTLFHHSSPHSYKITETTLHNVNSTIATDININKKQLHDKLKPQFHKEELFPHSYIYISIHPKNTQLIMLYSS